LRVGLGETATPRRAKTPLRLRSGSGHPMVSCERSMPGPRARHGYLISPILGTIGAKMAHDLLQIREAQWRAVSAFCCARPAVLLAACQRMAREVAFANAKSSCCLQRKCVIAAHRGRIWNLDYSPQDSTFVTNYQHQRAIIRRQQSERGQQPRERYHPACCF